MSSFMQPVAYESDYLYIDGPMGGEVIPCDVVDFQPSDEMRKEAVVESSVPPGSWVSITYPDGAFAVPEELKDYTENKQVWTIERKHGWVGRMSASGYMDCTDWESADSEEELLSQLKEYHGCTECGEFEDDCTCGKEESDA